MHLRVARLCVDCDEIHEEQTCPVCGSESFGYISRWIPAPERRARPRPVVATPAVDNYREVLAAEHARSGQSRWVRRGVIGVTAVSLVGWFFRRTAAAAEREKKSRTNPQAPKS